MAGRLAGVSDVEWRLCEDGLPPAPPQRRRGRPQAPFRKILHTLLSILMTGCRWCDVPPGPPWGGEERPASLGATGAGGWPRGRDAGAEAR